MELDSCSSSSLIPFLDLHGMVVILLFLFSVSDWYHLNIGYDCVLNKFGVTVQSWRFLSSVKQLWTYMCES